MPCPWRTDSKSVCRWSSRLLDAVWPELGFHPDMLTHKRLLHETLARPLPQAIVQRPKQGFILPFERWLAGDLAPAVRDGLDRLAAGGWIRRDARRSSPERMAQRHRALEPPVGAVRARAFSGRRMNPRAMAKRALLDAVAALTQRHPVLLPRAAADEASILAVEAPYRVQDIVLTIQILERAHGTLAVQLGIPGPHNSSRLHWSSDPIPYDGPVALRFDVQSGTIALGDRTLGISPVPLPSRRFTWTFRLDPQGGASSRARVTGHYLPGSGVVDDTYYSGDNYVDYEAESLTTRESIVGFARQYPSTGTALEIGCATGALLEDLQRAGFDAVGVDYSAWAVERARARVGADRVWQMDIERDRDHASVSARGPYGALIRCRCLEHFADPFGVLERLSALVAPGGRLFLTTTNAGGLGRSLSKGLGRVFRLDASWRRSGECTVAARRTRPHRLAGRSTRNDRRLGRKCRPHPRHAA